MHEPQTKPDITKGITTMQEGNVKEAGSVFSDNALTQRIERIQMIREAAQNTGNLAMSTADRVFGVDPKASNGLKEPPEAISLIEILDTNLDALESAVRAVHPHVERLSRI